MAEEECGENLKGDFLVVGAKKAIPAGYKSDSDETINYAMHFIAE